VGRAAGGGGHKKDNSTNSVFPKARNWLAWRFEERATPTVAVLAVKVEPLRGR
jgi:hypothetical protein